MALLLDKLAFWFLAQLAWRKQHVDRAQAISGWSAGQKDKDEESSSSKNTLTSFTDLAKLVITWKTDDPDEVGDAINGGKSYKKKNEKPCGSIFGLWGKWQWMRMASLKDIKKKHFHENLAVKFWWEESLAKDICQPCDELWSHFSCNHLSFSFYILLSFFSPFLYSSFAFFHKNGLCHSIDIISVQWCIQK